MTSLRTFIFLATLSILLWLFFWAKALLLPIAVAVLLAFILKPLVSSLDRTGLNHAVSVIVVTIFAFVLVAGIGTALTLEVKEFVSQLPAYQDNIARKIAALRDARKGSFLEDVEKTVQHIDQRLSQDASREPTTEPVPVRIDSSNLWEWTKVVGPAADGLATAALIGALVIFILIYHDDLRGRLILLVGQGQLAATTHAMDEAARRIGRYLLMQIVINASLGLAVSAGLALIGIPYAILWGVLAGALRFIPFLGIWLVAIPVLALVVAISPGWTQPLLAAGLFVGLEALVSQAVEPLVLGHSTGIIPTALLIAAAFWTWLWGPFGLLLSTPLTTCLVVLGKYVPGLEFLGVLLADQGITAPEILYYQRLLARDQDGAVGIIEAYLRSHHPETVFDDVLIPALVQAKNDQALGRLGVDDQEFAYRVTREIVEDLLPPRVAQQESGQEHSAEPARPTLTLIGCPAGDEADELALQMFRQLLAASESVIWVDIMSVKALVAEAISQINEEPSAVVCIAAIPPGGTAQARHLCKRLRSLSPNHRIIVGRWGAPREEGGQIRGRFQDLQVDHVATTLLESRSQILPWMQLPPQPVANPPLVTAPAGTIAPAPSASA